MQKHRRVALALAIGLLFGGSCRGEDSDVKEVEKAIGALNAGFEKRDARVVRAWMTKDHMAVTPYYGRPFTVAEQLATLPDVKLEEYSAGKMKITLLGQDTALVTYWLTLKGTFKGKQLAPRSFASAIWVKRDGAWREAFYQETALSDR